MPHAVDVDADADVLAGEVAGPVAPGADDDGRRISGLGADLDDAAAQIGASAQRVEEVKVVVGDQRRGQRFGDLAGAAQHESERAGGRGSAQRRAAVDGGCGHATSLTYGCVGYDSVG